MIYTSFESITAPEDNGQQDSEESYTNEYQKHVAYIYGYKLGFADDKFSKPVKSYLGEDAVYNFINSMIKENKYCSNVMENILTKNF